MDLEAHLLSRLDEEARRHWSCIVCVFMAVILVVSAVLAALQGYTLFVDPDLTIGHIKFSMEPVAYTGLDGASPPSFNVTLQATSTFSHSFCTGGGGATLQAAFSGLTVAVGKVAPFCLEPRAPAVIAGTVSSAWTALPQDFQDRISRGREKGGVELEVNLSFQNKFKGDVWLRCRAMLDANLNKTPCTSFTRTPFIPF
ncbi:hypothetical protein PVAP13_5KG334807 [Panicum virgatum]|uniref:Uncharacterized protein n=1 Tax=Panicum virgatum TaxID=38727 RepID=A0A8T0SIJ4_PANVG|nr:hypothetical protein PVAP13_5KG334807 [Panicum virgatum]